MNRQNFKTRDGMLHPRPASKFDQELLTNTVTHMVGKGYDGELLRESKMNRLVASPNSSYYIGMPIEKPSRPYYVDFSRPYNEPKLMNYVV